MAQLPKKTFSKRRPNRDRRPKSFYQHLPRRMRPDIFLLKARGDFLQIATLIQDAEISPIAANECVTLMLQAHPYLRRNQAVIKIAGQIRSRTSDHRVSNDAQNHVRYHETINTNPLPDSDKPPRSPRRN